MQRREQLLRRQGVRGELSRSQLEQLLETGHPDFEEFVEVCRGNAQETQPLQQRHRLVERLVQHPLVEFEERQLAVDVILRRF